MTSQALLPKMYLDYSEYLKLSVRLNLEHILREKLSSELDVVIYPQTNSRFIVEIDMVHEIQSLVDQVFERHDFRWIPLLGSKYDFDYKGVTISSAWLSNTIEAVALAYLKLPYRFENGTIYIDCSEHDFSRYQVVLCKLLDVMLSLYTKGSAIISPDSDIIQKWELVPDITVKGLYVLPLINVFFMREPSLFLLSRLEGKQEIRIRVGPEVSSLKNLSNYLTRKHIPFRFYDEYVIYEAENLRHALKLCYLSHKHRFSSPKIET